MENTQENSDPSARIRYAIGMTMIAFGYTLGLAGGLTFFRIPLWCTFALLLASTIPPVVGAWEPRLAFKTVGSQYLYLNMGGTITIVAVMLFSMRADWQKWPIHPAGFQCTWWIVCSAIIHFRDIWNRREKKSAPVDATQYIVNEPASPYAPPSTLSYSAAGSQSDESALLIRTTKASDLETP